MAFVESLSGLIALSARVLNPLQPLVAFVTRLYVCDVFLRSGWLKLSTWDSTLSLFETEYHVPVLPPHVAAVIGTFGELFFPTLLIVGFAGRLSAIGLFMVNAMAVVSYAQVLLSDGFEAALGQHVLWGFMLLVLAAFGPGPISLDRLLTHSRRTPAPMTPSAAVY